MGLFDKIADAPDTSLGDGKHAFIDADTLQDAQGNNLRIAGIQAPEVEKVIGGQYKLGTAGGQAATDAISSLARSQGFTNIVPVLDANGEPLKDEFGRAVVDLKDSTGKSFESALLESGVMDPTKYETTSDADRLTHSIGQLRREQAALKGEVGDSPWDAARQQVLDGMEAEGAKQQGFRRAALDEASLAAANAHGLGRFYQQDNVQIRDPGRSLDNQSLNPFSDSWEQGWLGVQEGAYGFIEMLGESTGVNYFDEVGEAGVQRIRNKLGDEYGTTVLDWKDVDGFDTGLQYITNNMAMSLPYMIGTIGAAGVSAAAAPVIGGVAATGVALSPGLIYSGQVWNEMEGEKSAAVALSSGVAQAALDRLGLSFLTGTAKGVGGKDLLKRGVDALVNKGMTRDQAEKAVAAASRKELAGFLGDAATIAKQQVTAKQAAKALLTKGAVGAAGEGLTEVGQETIAYTGAVLGSDKEFDWAELHERQVAALIAGSALGGAFSVPGTAYDIGAWADVAVRQAPAEAKRLSQRGAWAQEEIEKHGRVQTVKELNEETSDYLKTAGDVVTLEERVAADKARKRERTFEEKAGDLVNAIPGLFSGSVRHIIPESLQARSRTARKMADKFGGQLQRVFSGAAYENEKHHRVSIYKNMVPIPNKFFANQNGGKIPTNDQKRQISDKVYQTMWAAIDPKTGNMDVNSIADPEIKKLAIQMENLSNNMWLDQKKHNPDLGKLKNYLARYKSLNKESVSKHKDKFIQLLHTKKGVPLDDAKNIAEAIINDANVNDFGEAYSTIKGEFTPGSHQKRSLDLAEDADFADFMNQDLFANISAAAKSAARYTTQQEFVGRNGSKVAADIQKIQQELIDAGADPSEAAAEANKLAAGMQNFLDAESGNYKRAQSKFGKDLEKIQKNFMTWSTLAGLPLAAISSFVEFALTQKALTKSQMSDLKTTGHEMGKMFWDWFGKGSEWSGKRHYDSNPSAGQNRLQNLGYYEWDVGAATVTGTTEVKASQQRIFDIYFNVTGLTQWTNFTRALRGTIAMDFIEDHMQLIMDSDPANVTNEVQESKEMLRNIGINVDDMVAIRTEMEKGPLTPEMQQMLEDNLREGMFNFINDAVALPQSANRPLIYQDPRFALFTQFQGFIATFTANHIPKLWGEYVKRGTPSMKYNAFAVMSTMIMLGFASQYLKDLIKYGPGNENPYLEDPEYIQRGIRASGLLGTGERVLDIFAPIYEKRSRGPGDWLYNQVTGESPAAANLARASKGALQTISGDPEEGGRNLFKTLPLASPFSAHFWEPETHEWKFK